VIPPRPPPEAAGPSAARCLVCRAPSHQPPQCPFIAVGSIYIQRLAISSSTDASKLDKGRLQATQIKQYNDVLRRVRQYEQAIVQLHIGSPSNPYGRCWVCVDPCSNASVKACVESRGGRPSLKKRIRQLSNILEERGAVQEDDLMARTRGILMGVYKQVSDALTC
jgi:hypothetical protein